MIIVDTKVYELGRFTVQQRPRPDSPAWAVYIVFLGDKLIGRQFSTPTVSDCEWLERQQHDEIVYARQSAALLKYTVFTKQGRPANGTRRLPSVYVVPEEEVT